MNGFDALKNVLTNKPVSESDLDLHSEVLFKTLTFYDDGSNLDKICKLNSLGFILYKPEILKRLLMCKFKKVKKCGKYIKKPKAPKNEKLAVSGLYYSNKKELQLIADLGHEEPKSKIYKKN